MTEDMMLNWTDISSGPVFIFYVSFNFLSTQFPFLHLLLLCIISSYPFAIPFIFKLCKKFSSLIAISCLLSAQFCSRPQILQRTQTLQEQCYFLDVTALGRGKWPRSTEPILYNQDALLRRASICSLPLTHENTGISEVLSILF